MICYIYWQFLSNVAGEYWGLALHCVTAFLPDSVGLVNPFAAIKCRIFVSIYIIGLFQVHIISSQ
jgi:hypothetical protein